MCPLHSDALLAHLSQCKASAKQQVNSMIDAIYANVLLDLELWLNKHDSNDLAHVCTLNHNEPTHSNDSIKSEIDSDCEENATDHNLPGESPNWQPTPPELLPPTHSISPHSSYLQIVKKEIVDDDEDSRVIQPNSNEQSTSGYLPSNNEINEDVNTITGNDEFRELVEYDESNRLPQYALARPPSDLQMHFEDDLEIDQDILNEVKREIEEEEEMKRRESRHEGGDEKHDGDTFGDSFQHNSVVIEQDIEINNAIGEEIATECTTNPTQSNLVQPNRHLQCSHCHKSFGRKFTLQRHLRVHTGERPFQCDQCGKRFSEKCNLTNHQLIHQNIKRFQCDQCGKQFTQKFNLESHLLTHSGGRPHQCRFCEKSFTQWNSRKTHEQAIHLQVKPYRCKQCGHTAAERSHVIKHIRVVHFGLPQTIKQQRALNIIDDRDPRELIEKV